MLEEKPKLNWQRLLITLGFVLLAALVVGGATWYVMDKSAKEIKTANDQSVSSLEKQVSELKVRATTSNNESTTDTTATTSSNTVDIKNLDLKSLAGEDMGLGKFLDTVYADVNNDGKNEAVLTFQQDGTGGYKDYFIYGLSGSSAKLLYSTRGVAHGQMTLLKNNLGLHIVYVDATDPINSGKPNSDMVASRSLSVTWNGSIYLEGRQIL